MRDYSKVSPRAWHGSTFKALRRDSKGLVVGLYLLTSPSSNMLGLYSQPVLYMAHETGLGEQGALEGLQKCIEAGFCSYDEESEMVWVHEMASYQVGDELKPTDLRCKGIQKDYDTLPANPFLGQFFDRYVKAFNLTHRRESLPQIPVDNKAPCKPLTKPLRSQEQEQETEQESNTPHIPPKAGKAPAIGLKAWLEQVKAKGEKAIPDDDQVFVYADEVGIPADFLRLAWAEFRGRYTQPNAKRYIDWRSVFRKAVRGNWLKLWWVDAQGVYTLTTAGAQAQRMHRPKDAA